MESKKRRKKWNDPEILLYPFLLMHFAALPRAPLVSHILLATLPGPAPLLCSRAARPSWLHRTPLPNPSTLSRGNYSAGAAPPSLSYQTISARLLYTDWLMNELGLERPVPRSLLRDLESDSRRSSRWAEGKRDARGLSAAGICRQRCTQGRGPRTASRPRTAWEMAPSHLTDPPPPASGHSRALSEPPLPLLPLHRSPPEPSPRRPPSEPCAAHPEEGGRSSSAAASRSAVRRRGPASRACAVVHSEAGRRAFPMVGAPLRTAPPSDPRPFPGSAAAVTPGRFPVTMAAAALKVKEGAGLSRAPRLPRGRAPLGRGEAGGRAGRGVRLTRFVFGSAGRRKVFAVGGCLRGRATERARPPGPLTPPGPKEPRSAGGEGSGRPPMSGHLRRGWAEPRGRPLLRSAAPRAGGFWGTSWSCPPPPAATRSRSELSARLGPSELPAGLALRGEPRTLSMPRRAPRPSGCAGL